MIFWSWSGSIPLINASGSRRPKNIRIRWIRIRNTVFHCKLVPIFWTSKPWIRIWIRIRIGIQSKILDPMPYRWYPECRRWRVRGRADPRRRARVPRQCSPPWCDPGWRTGLSTPALTQFKMKPWMLSTHDASMIGTQNLKKNTGKNSIINKNNPTLFQRTVK